MKSCFHTIALYRRGIGSLLMLPALYRLAYGDAGKA